ncbi:MULTISPECIES: DNA-methyltransferase [unclassified Methanoculleus]|uniref:Type II methyltransferase n=1 Tax=Methanoculleus palmolei TaxID=72612 RepID=A0ABD8A7S1_9EURY|nr:site-specific DNA-methyltransferase [Methanoculleus sp. UBA377]WOX55078.1 site-specific DNA-methyltransferase [Methanoculleus palmolei]
MNSTLILGDCDTGMATLPDDSVNLIFTDPPYLGKTYEQAYSTLARHAPRILKSSGFLVMYCPQFYLNRIMHIFEDAPGLSYFWTVAQLNSGAKTVVWARKVICGWKPILIYQKPPITPVETIFLDVVSGARAKQFHQWEQSIQEPLHLLSRLTQPGDLVLDPYAGSGTSLLAAKLLNLSYLGYEIDPLAYETARARLQQEPLTISTPRGQGVAE